ncbi:MAG: imidazoleglycerol-phosphate dehydratase HisB [Firmicutes bacterium]|nr:imidazoleglycerol-phosphate dehydratase HisB [Bacillota bacterium]
MEEVRTGVVQRKTAETDIRLELTLDGSGQHQIDTGVPFFDHMLTLFTVHSLCDLKVIARGDVAVDDHHTVEDVGICLGQAIKMALKEKKGITRYGEATIPMDEALVRVVLDLSGRPLLVYNVAFQRERIGNFATENGKEFFQAVANFAGMNLHIDLIRGENAHHITEAIFKAFGRAFKAAVRIEPRIQGVWSSKKALE